MLFQHSLTVLLFLILNKLRFLVLIRNLLYQSLLFFLNLITMVTSFSSANALVLFNARCIRIRFLSAYSLTLRSILDCIDFNRPETSKIS